MMAMRRATPTDYRRQRGAFAARCCANCAKDGGSCDSLDMSRLRIDGEGRLTCTRYLCKWINI